MELSAEVSCEYKSEDLAEAIASSVEPDNLDSPEGVEVTTQRKGRLVKSKIRLDGEIETLLATMDDLLSCISTAEKVL